MPNPCLVRQSGITHTFDPTFHLLHSTVDGDDVMCRLMDCCQTPVPSFNPLETDGLRCCRSRRFVFAVTQFQHQCFQCLSRMCNATKKIVYAFARSMYTIVNNRAVSCTPRPSPKANRMRCNVNGVVLGRPRCLPDDRARPSPAITRSRIIARSIHCDNMPNKARPNGKRSGPNAGLRFYIEGSTVTARNGSVIYTYNEKGMTPYSKAA